MFNISAQTKGYCYVLTTVFCWGAAYVAIKGCIQDFSPGALALLRGLIASLCMIIVYRAHYRCHDYRSSTTKIILISGFLGTLGIGLYNVLLNMSEQALSASTIGFLGGQIPLITTILALAFLKESLSKWGYVGILISFFGISLIAYSGHNRALEHAAHSHFFYLCCMLIAIIMAGVYSCLQKPVLKQIHPIKFACIAIWSATFCLLYFAHDLYHDLQTAHVHSIGYAVFLGIFPSAIAYLTWSKGLSILSACQAAALVYFMPIITILLSILILHDQPNFGTLLGGSIAMVGAWINHKYGKLKC